MELQDLDKLIIEMGMLADKCIEWKEKLEIVKYGGGMNRYDVDAMVLMVQLLKFDVKSLEQTVLTTTSNFIKNQNA